MSVKIIKKLLGIDLLEHLLEQDLKELSSTDLIILGKIKRLEKDIQDLCVYLKIERKEEWIEDKKFSPPQPKLVKSEWVKKKKK